MAVKVSKASASRLNASDDYEGVVLSPCEEAVVTRLAIFEAESLSIGIGYLQCEVARSSNVHLADVVRTGWLPHG